MGSFAFSSPVVFLMQYDEFHHPVNLCALKAIIRFVKACRHSVSQNPVIQWINSLNC